MKLSEVSDYTICIIDGVARSGTTFLAAVINSFPDTFILQETFRFPKFYQDMHGCICYPFSLSVIKRPIDTDFGKMIPSYIVFEKNYAMPYLAKLENKEKEERILERLRKKVMNKSYLSYIALFNLFYKSLAEEYNVSIVGGKTTFCHNYKNQMLLNIPNLKWIDVVRDIRGVMCSGIVGVHSISSLGKNEPWREQINSIKNLSIPKLEERHLVVKYEELIMKKEETINTIGRFLNIKNFNYKEWEKEPILKNNGALFGTHSSFDESGKLLKKSYFRDGKPFDVKPIARWESFFTIPQKWLLTNLFRKELLFLNYPIKKYFHINIIILFLYVRICLTRFMFNLLGVLKKTL